MLITVEAMGSGALGTHVERWPNCMKGQRREVPVPTGSGVTRQVAAGPGAPTGLH